ncbi:Methyltransferase-like protein 24, partial [Durusdinium trenchii]
KHPNGPTRRCFVMGKEGAIEAEDVEMQEEQEVPTKFRRRKWDSRALLYLCATLIFLVQAFATVLLLTLLLTLIWKGNIDVAAHFTVVTFLFLLTLTPCFLSMCQRCGLRSRLWRCVLISAPLLALLSFTSFFLVLYFAPASKVLNASFDVSKPVLVVGSGPSGNTNVPEHVSCSTAGDPT